MIFFDATWGPSDEPRTRAISLFLGVASVISVENDFVLRKLSRYESTRGV